MVHVPLWSSSLSPSKVDDCIIHYSIPITLPIRRDTCMVSGEKRAIYWVRHYLLCVSIDGQHSAAAPSSSSSPAGSSRADVLHAFDLRNKLSAVRVDAGAAITALVPVWGGVTALTADGRVVILRVCFCPRLPLFVILQRIQCNHRIRSCDPRSLGIRMLLSCSM